MLLITRPRRLVPKIHIKQTLSLGFIKMFTRSGDDNVAREAQMIQEMYQAMGRMEERIETLETILLEKDGKEKKS